MSRREFQRSAGYARCAPTAEGAGQLPLSGGSHPSQSFTLAIQALVNPILAPLSPRCQSMYATSGRCSLSLERLLRAVAASAVPDSQRAAIDGATRLQRAAPLGRGTESRRCHSRTGGVHEAWGPADRGTHRRCVRARSAQGRQHARALVSRAFHGRRHPARGVRESDELSPQEWDDVASDRFQSEEPDGKLPRRQAVEYGARIDRRAGRAPQPQDSQHRCRTRTDWECAAGQSLRPHYRHEFAGSRHNAEREATLEFVVTVETRARRSSLGVDRGYDVSDPVPGHRACQSTPHAPPIIHAKRPRRLVDGHTTRHSGFALVRVKARKWHGSSLSRTRRTTSRRCPRSSERACAPEQRTTHGSRGAAAGHRENAIPWTVSSLPSAPTNLAILNDADRFFQIVPSFSSSRMRLGGHGR